MNKKIELSPRLRMVAELVPPGSRLAEHGDPHDHDHLHAMHPNTCWRAAIEHGKKIGLGTDEYTVIEVK